jgi:hypothetical protein
MATYFEEGRYKARISAVELGEARNEKKTPQVVLTLDLLGRYEDSDGELYEYPSASRFPPQIFLSVTEATMGTEGQPGWVAQTLAYLGFQGNFDEIAQVEGWEGDVINQHRPNQNNDDRDNWSILRPKEKGPPPDKKTVRTLNSRIGKLFGKPKDQPPTNGTRPQAKPKPKPKDNPRPTDNAEPEPVGQAESEIPF